jgi:Muconolactone delta-isomerase
LTGLNPAFRQDGNGIAVAQVFQQATVFHKQTATTMQTILPFMVTAGLRIGNPMAFFALLPEHRQRVDTLIRQGQIVSYTVAADRQTLWMTVMAPTEQAVMDLIASLPLAPFLSPDVQPALFFDSQAIRLPQLSMN